jgi:predicted secreted protein
MDWFTGIIVFLLIWWLVIFLVLPWGLERDESGKPHDPQLKKKVVLTTLLSIVLWCIVYVLVRMDVISFHDIAMQMIQGDMQP